MTNLLSVPRSDLEAELCRQSFYDFVQTFWSTIIAEKLIDNWHIEYICKELQAIGERVAKRLPKQYDYLIINVPPGSSKSTIVSEMYPLWCWTIDPTQRFICGSYASTPAEDIAEKCFNIYNSDKFKELFPHLTAKAKGGKTHFKNGLRGERYTTSTGSGITGIHGHQIILDDPMSTQIADSETERKTANKWISETISSRKVDNDITTTILVMQRLHEFDTTGYLLKKEGLNIRHICIPVEESADIKPPELAANYVDGLFDPKRRSREGLLTTKIDLGSYGYAGQMMMRPSPADGGLLKKEWFRIISKAEAPQRQVINFQCDTAYTDKKKNDPSGTLCYFKTNGILYLTHYSGVRKEFPQFCNWLVTHANEQGYSNYSSIYIEPKANGKPIVQQIRYTTELNVIEDTAPKVSKVARANSCSPKMESGRVYLIEGHWNESFLNQLAAFPNAHHDEEVDCLTAVIERELIRGNTNGQYDFG
jgi:predicted phage terminase large subunit-like protein